MSVHPCRFTKYFFRKENENTIQLLVKALLSTGLRNGIPIFSLETYESEKISMATFGMIKVSELDPLKKNVNFEETHK